jgi:surface polysaccharide O-acyltransferase-like enzyme
MHDFELRNFLDALEFAYIFPFGLYFLMVFWTRLTSGGKLTPRANRLILALAVVPLFFFSIGCAVYASASFLYSLLKEAPWRTTAYAVLVIILTVLALWVLWKWKLQTKYWRED